MLKLTTTAQLESPRSFCQAVRKLERLVARNIEILKLKARHFLWQMMRAQQLPIEILKFLYHWPKSSNFCSM